jgi:hypothetical protein
MPNIKLSTTELGAAFTPARTAAITRALDTHCGISTEAKRVASFTYRRQLTIEWGQCDPAGIVFNSRFFEIFDTSTWQLFDAALGVKPHELSTAFGIMGIPLVDARANFLKPVRFGDVVDMTSRTAFRSAANSPSRATKPASGRCGAKMTPKRSRVPRSPPA